MTERRNRDGGVMTGTNWHPKKGMEAEVKAVTINENLYALKIEINCNDLTILVSERQQLEKLVKILNKLETPTTDNPDSEHTAIL